MSVNESVGQVMAMLSRLESGGHSRCQGHMVRTVLLPVKMISF